jgi:hypothetical protein
VLRVLKIDPTWPRSARQLGQRNPKITKLGTLHWLPRAIYKGGEFRVGRDESLS